MRVYLQRQVTIFLKGNQLTRKFSIGEGNLRPLPPSTPPPSILRSQPLEHGLSTLDYEGEVRPNPNTAVGQFGMSRLQVRVWQFISRLAACADMNFLFGGAGLYNDVSLSAKFIYITI